MKKRGKSNFCIVNSNKECASNKLANSMHNKVEKNQVLSLETIKQELCKTEKREGQRELDMEQENNPHKSLLI